VCSAKQLMLRRQIRAITSSQRHRFSLIVMLGTMTSVSALFLYWSKNSKASVSCCIVHQAKQTELPHTERKSLTNPAVRRTSKKVQVERARPRCASDERALRAVSVLWSNAEHDISLLGANLKVSNLRGAVEQLKDNKFTYKRSY